MKKSGNIASNLLNSCLLEYSASATNPHKLQYRQTDLNFNIHLAALKRKKKLRMIFAHNSRLNAIDFYHTGDLIYAKNFISLRK